MADWKKDYWSECISIAADECGLSMTQEQLDCMADSVKGGHENYSMASGDDVFSANLTASKAREVSDLKKVVQREKDKVHCRNCNGSGSVHTYGGTMMSTSQCWVCDGEGRHDP